MNKYWKKFLLASVILVVAVYAIMLLIDLGAYWQHGSQCGVVKLFPCSFMTYIKNGFTFTGILGRAFGKFLVLPILIVPVAIGYIIDTAKLKK